jgi:hypothetical protein
MLAYLFVIAAVAVRFLPHPWAFTPVGAALLYFGARAPRKRMWIPLALLAIADVILMGGLLREKARPLRLLGASVATSVSFFALSNLAVWAVWAMYPKTVQGLIACYAAAVPFFRTQVVADALFVAAFFGVPALVEALTPQRHRAAA